MAKLTKSERLELAATIYEEMLDGESDADIMRTHGLDEEVFRDAKRFMLEEASATARAKPREHVYVEYCIEQDNTLRALNTLVEGLDAKKQYNAVVGALRLRSEIIDKKINKGFEFGVIKKEPDRKEILGGFVLADLSNSDLRKGIADITHHTHDLISKYGDGDILSLTPGELHYGEGSIVAEAEEVEETPEPVPAKKKRRERAQKEAQR